MVRADEVGRRTLISATVAAPPELDPAAEVFRARLASDRWFAWEQPDAGFALAALGQAHEATSRGPDRVADVAREVTRINGTLLCEQPDGLPAGAGPLWTGGLAFDPEGAGSPPWSSFAPAQLTLPELSLVRDRDGAWVTANLLVAPGVDPVPALRRIRGRAESLGSATLPLADPSLTGRASIRSARPPEEFEQAVERARDEIRSGRIEKVVLAREVLVESAAALDPAPLFGTIRELFPACFCFCVGTPEAAFIGASPELLIRRRGARAATVALAGSTRRSADPAVDDHLGEQLLRSPKDRLEHEIVARRIERSLRPLSVWVTRAPEPELVRVANIQHLATPIRAQLADSQSALELAGRLHPTPAVGGEPWDAAAPLITELEHMDRGWYAAPIGWMDAAEDGEFCVGLRSALLRDRTAHVYAGVGLVGDSDPAAELAETELKLGAMLPLLSG